MGSGGSASGHDHAGHEHGAPADAGAPAPEQVDDPEVAEALREAREMTRKAAADADEDDHPSTDDETDA
jgi:hypothetical protein